ncbi:MAG: hypothetical protein KF784_01010 [Fimbriimonadaceae bacterium]|nr:hypothetical protein [Fimbriimonadaceae bacterium]
MNLASTLFSGVIFLTLVSLTPSIPAPVSPLTKATTTAVIGEAVADVGKNVWVIYQDKKNNYWFGSDGQGVYRYDGKAITQFSTKDGLPNNRIREIKEDKSGNIFISTLDGICKFDGRTFTTLNVVKTDKGWRLHSDDLWFKGASNEPGPFRYDGKTLYLLKFPKHYLEDQITKETPYPAASPYSIYTIYKDTKGNVWFGTANLGACRYDGKSLTWIYERHLSEIEGGGSFGIRTIGEDKSGKFWICSNRFRYAMSAGMRSGKSNVIDYTREDGISHTASKSGYDPIFFESMTRDDQQNLWMSSNGSGVWRFDGRSLKHFPVKTGSSWLITVYKDNNGDIWLGTDSAGVFKLDGSEFKPFQP